MKKTFIILIFVIAISASSPSNPVLIQRARHLIEYSQDNKKEASTDELLKQKIVCYMRVEILRIKIQLIENSLTAQYNSS